MMVAITERFDTQALSKDEQQLRMELFSDLVDELILLHREQFGKLFSTSRRELTSRSDTEIFYELAYKQGFFGLIKSKIVAKVTMAAMYTGRTRADARIVIQVFEKQLLDEARHVALQFRNTNERYFAGGVAVLLRASPEFI